MPRRILALASLVLLALFPLCAREQKLGDDVPSTSNAAPAPAPAESTDAPPEMPKMKMNASDMRNMAGMNNDGTTHAMLSMEGRQMSMGPHMKMTTLRDLKPGDQEKADQVVAAARKAAEKYTDYKIALADGYKIFLPNIPQPQYHFTNNWYGFEAAFRFNPDHPTSLLYEKTKDGGYNLIGAMYTAPTRYSEDDLNQRVPLSVAQWHQHVNMCRPPKGQEASMLSKNPKFGLNGSISTQEECQAAGGTFMPHVFGWMVHMYPWEKTSDEIWSVERQLQDKPASEGRHH